MRPFPCFLLLAALPLVAQEPQRAIPVDPALLPNQGEDFFKRAQNLYDDAQRATNLETRIFQYERAADLFTQYLSQNPKHENAQMAWWYLGNSQYQSGHQDEAKRTFHILLNRYQDGPWAAAAAYTLAADHYNKAEYAFAVPLFEVYAKNATKPGERPRGNFFAGNCYRMLNRTREATLSYRKVVDDPTGGIFTPQATVALGQLAILAGRHEEALAEFQKVIEDRRVAPSVRGEAALHGAISAAKLGEAEKSDLYLQLVLRTPGMEEFRPDAQTALMANHFAKEEYREVIALFRRSSLKAEGVKEAARVMIAARAHMRLNQYTDASTLFRDVEQLVPPENDMAFEASYYRLLCFYEIEGRHVPEQVDGFLQIYSKSRRADPRVQTALMMKAESLFSAGEPKLAAKVYAEVDGKLVSEKNRPGLYFQRGWCLAEAGDHGAAIRSLSEFIDGYPKDERVTPAIAKRARCYVESGEKAKAIFDFDRIASAKDAPADLVKFAWLESARLRRESGEIDDMVVRYRGLLANVPQLTDQLAGEANYWIGWGLIKSNMTRDAVPYLEKSRMLRPETYEKHAGILLTLGYFAAQDPDALAAELNLAIDKEYVIDVPDQAIRWSAMQQYNQGDYKSAARFLRIGSTPDEPRETPKEVWRYLAKSLIELGEGEDALKAAENVLEVEDNTGWRADGMLDQARALFLLERFDDSRATVQEALELRPQGRTSAGLRILSGDLARLAGDLSGASSEYLIVIKFHEDKDLRPLAMHKHAEVLAAAGKPDEASAVKKNLATEYPDWEAPAETE